MDRVRISYDEIDYSSEAINEFMRLTMDKIKTDVRSVIIDLLREVEKTKDGYIQLNIDRTQSSVNIKLNNLPPELSKRIMTKLHQVQFSNYSLS